MKVVIRCHIRNDKRLALMKRTIDSYINKQLNNDYQLHVMDDASPMQEEVVKLCSQYPIVYHRSGGKNCTINGLVESFRLADPGEIIACGTEDIVFGKGVKARMRKLLKHEIPYIGDNWGFIGVFACYPHNVRQQNKVAHTDLWRYQWPIIYALNFDLYSPIMMKHAIDRWDQYLRGEIKRPTMEDDIYIKELAKEFKLPCYNTNKDYIQHTGRDARSFGSKETHNGSHYTTAYFTGE